MSGIIFPQMHLLLLSPKTRGTAPAGLDHSSSADFLGNGAESLAFLQNPLLFSLNACGTSIVFRLLNTLVVEVPQCQHTLRSAGLGVVNPNISQAAPALQRLQA